MVCYVPGTGTLAVIGLVIYLAWHKAIGHFLHAVGAVMESTLMVGAAVAAITLVIWTARMIQRRRAVAGACTTCRFRCQQALQPRPNLLVNIVDRRQPAPKPVPRASLTCHPAAPILGRARTPARHAASPAPALFRRAAARLRTPVHVQAPAAASAHAAVRAPAAVPAAALFRRAIARRRTPALAPAVLFERAIAAHRTPVEPAPLLPVLGAPVLSAPVLSAPVPAPPSRAVRGEPAAARSVHAIHHESAGTPARRRILPASAPVFLVRPRATPTPPTRTTGPARIPEPPGPARIPEPPGPARIREPAGPAEADESVAVDGCALAPDGCALAPDGVDLDAAPA